MHGIALGDAVDFADLVASVAAPWAVAASWNAAGAPNIQHSNTNDAPNIQ